MAIKRFSYENMQSILSKIEEGYAKKTELAALNTAISKKADAATTLAGYGITDGMTATQVATAISEAIAGADHLSRKIVSSTEEINVNAEGAEKYIYMVAKAKADSGDTYDEYMIVNGTLEKVGDWKVDLSDYAKTAEVTQAITNALTVYAKTADVTAAISQAVTGLIKLDSLSTETTGAGNVVTSVEYSKETGKTTVKKGITALTESDLEEYSEEEINALFETE